MQESTYNILILDDELILRKTIGLHLVKLGYKVFEAGGLAEANLLLTNQTIDLILCDWKLGSESGLDFLKDLEVQPLVNQDRPSVLFMSAHASSEIALKAIELGAQDYLAKPFEMSELAFRVKRIFEHRQVKVKIAELEKAQPKESDLLFHGMIGQSALMRRLFSVIERVASSSSKLLIQGESGTGKELVAKAVHQIGSSSSRPFIAVNCAAIPESLIESELFGHVKGAFTHANHDRKGLIEEADGGTFFLDEIGELSMGLQSKLLRLLQEGEVRRVGSNLPIKVNVRFIAATHKNLEEEVKKLTFREDLYYRLSVIPITVPALRERLEDLPILFEYFLSKMSLRMNRSKPRLSHEALKLMLNYEWPGNVRELENCVEYALILSEHNLIKPNDLPERIYQSSRIDNSEPKIALYPHELIVESESLSIKKHTQELELLLITEALKRTKGIKTQAAKSLEISTKTLLYKLRDFQIDESQFS